MRTLLQYARSTARRFQCLFRNGFPGVEKVRRNEVVLEQVSARVMAEALHGQAFPMGEILRGAYGVDAAEEAADPFERIEVSELGVRRRSADRRHRRSRQSSPCGWERLMAFRARRCSRAKACSSSIWASAQLRPVELPPPQRRPRARPGRRGSRSWTERAAARRGAGRARRARRAPLPA